MFTKRPVHEHVPVPVFTEPTLGMGATAANPFTPGHWTQNLILRVCLGILFTASLSFAFRRLADAGLLLCGQDMERFWPSELGFYVWQALQLSALVVGTMLASAGRNNMTTLGLLIGAIVGFVSLCLMPINTNVPEVLYFMMPVWHGIAGLIGGKVGESLWHPPIPKRLQSANPLADQDRQGLSQTVRQAIANMAFANIRWLRVLFAVAIILGGLWYATEALNWTLRALQLQQAEVLQSGAQKKLIILMLQVVVVFCSATVAGATTTHGLAHGFWIGVIVGVANLLHTVLTPSTEPIDVMGVLSEIGWVWLVSLLAGGFGALAMPPVTYLAEKRKVNPSNIQVPLE